MKMGRMKVRRMKMGFKPRASRVEPRASRVEPVMFHICDFVYSGMEMVNKNLYNVAFKCAGCGREINSKMSSDSAYADREEGYAREGKVAP